MRDGATRDPRSEPSAGEQAADEEDFLFHLYRGTELLMQDRVVEAKEQLELALELQPQDAKGQDLLAGVYFRLGVYPRAIEIWQRLVDTYPRDSTLRVNLALALLKTGQPSVALDHISSGLQLNPDHGRAWGYLGLIQWRLGQFQQARDAFLRGGQAQMARRMEEVLGPHVEPVGPAGTVVDMAPERAAMRSAAQDAIERFEAEQIAIEPSASMKGAGVWRVGEPGEERVPVVRRPVGSASVPAPPSLATMLDAWLVALPERVPLAIGPEGQLFLFTHGNLYARLDGLRAVRGRLRTTPVPRRTRGRDLDELLGEGGDHHPIVLWRGPVSAVIEPAAESRFHALTLDDDVLYVREELVWAFDDRLGYESGKLALQNTSLTILQLYGTGTVVLALRGAPSALRIGEGEEVRVVPEALLGWTGRLLPRGKGKGATEPYGIGAPPLLFRGEGVVLVT
jgi:hypothetical protein